MLAVLIVSHTGVGLRVFMFTPARVNMKLWIISEIETATEDQW
jgi:hypothetical protein